jgi:hypothetical protein
MIKVLYRRPYLFYHALEQLQETIYFVLTN